MAGILLSKGPISTTSGIQRNGPRYLRHISQKQFAKAAKQLTEMNLGSIVQKGSLVFVKKPPDEAQVLQEQLADLCDMELYTRNYFEPTPAVITQKQREKLVALGFLMS